MLAASPIDWLAGLGWSGGLAFLVLLVGYLAIAHAVTRGVFGAPAGRGARLATGLAIAAAMAGAGALTRLAAVGPDGTLLRRLEQAAWGGMYGLVAGVWLILMSVRRVTADAPRVAVVPTPGRAVALPAWVPWFHSIVVGFTAIGFIGFGVVALIAAAGGIGDSGSAVFGTFGAVAILLGVGLARLAWVLGRRGRVE